MITCEYDGFSFGQCDMCPIPRMIYHALVIGTVMGSGFEGLFIRLKAKQTGNHVRRFKCCSPGN